jgi:cobalt-zinc-cadmium efflux system membrane fusion protein
MLKHNAILPRLFLTVLLVLGGAGDAFGQETAEEEGPANHWVFNHGQLEVSLALVEDPSAGPHFVAQIEKGAPAWARRTPLTVEITRLGGRQERFELIPQGDGRFLGTEPVGEPHAFSGRLLAPEEAASAAWRFAQVEGQTAIEPALQTALGITVATAAPQTLAPEGEAFGQLRLPPEATRPVQARFPGVVVNSTARLGDWVKAGTVLFTVESNNNLKRYDVIAPSDGELTGDLIGPGELVIGTEPLATLTDWRILWAELAVFPSLAAQLRPGMAVALYDAKDQPIAEGRIDRLDPRLRPDQSQAVYVTLSNPEGALKVGQWVRARIALPLKPAAVAVPKSALQRFRGGHAVYIQAEDRFEVRPVTLGARDGDWVEVQDGLSAGTRYVAENSFVLKADIEKAGAAHDH